MPRYKPPTRDQYVDPQYQPVLIPGIEQLDEIAKVAMNQGDLSQSQLDGLRAIAARYVTRHAKDPDPLATERCYQAALKSLNFGPSRVAMGTAMYQSCRSQLPPVRRPADEE
jgi:hypothetical protein